MPVARRESSGARVIAHIDMDCFYVQVEQRKQPDLRGQPTAVVQYNSWKGGCLIAVSYEARRYGVKRSMRGDEAKKVCPQIQLVQVPVSRGKADLSVYRNAGSEVVSIIATKGCCERASIDEVYLDLTDAAEAMLSETPPESLDTIDEEALKAHVLGLNEDGDDVKENVKMWLCRHDADHRDKLLACGALIVAEIRMQVLKETEFTCSAGIAHNKMLAKLASGMHKPAQQTIVPMSSVKGLLEPLPIKKMKQLGGKLGSSLQTDLGINTVGDLLQFSEEKLQERYGVNTGTWLWNIARGISGEEVEGRVLPKSHGSGKLFPGPQALRTTASVEHWLNALCEELNDRLCSDLDQNKRIAHTLTLHARAFKSSNSDSDKKFPSKSCPLRYGAAKIKEDALNLFQSGLREYLGSFRSKTQGYQNSGWGITALSVSASKIVSLPPSTCSIMKYFGGQDQSSSSKRSNIGLTQEVASLSPSGSKSYTGFCHTKEDIENHGKDIRTMFLMPSLHAEETERALCKSQETIAAMQPNDQGSMAMPLLGTEGSLLLDQNEPQKEFSREITGISYALYGQKSQDRKRKTVKEGSILRFLQNCATSSSSPMPEHGSLGLDAGCGLCNGCYESTEVEYAIENLPPMSGTEGDVPSSGRNEPRQHSWSYQIDEIDPAIIDELPPEIQQEIRAWIRPHKRADAAKRGPRIADYFLPTKKK